MKKIFAAILFFGSVSTAMAQITPGGWMPPLYGAGIWNPPAQSCGYIEKGEWRAKKYENSVSCETVTSEPAAGNLRTFKRNHPGYKLMLGKKEIGGCNAAVQYDARGIDPIYSDQNATNCGAVEAVPRGRAMGPKGSDVMADALSALRNFWYMINVTTPTILPAMSENNTWNAGTSATNASSAKACEWKADVEWVVTSKTPIPCATCETAQMKISRAQMMIWEVEMMMEKIRSMSTDEYFTEAMKREMLNRALVQFTEARKKLVAAMSECKISAKSCKLEGEPSMDGSAAAGEGGSITCTRIPEKCCIEPSPTGQCIPCRPYHDE